MICKGSSFSTRTTSAPVGAASSVEKFLSTIKL
jgi:hypothetical protein